MDRSATNLGVAIAGGRSAAGRDPDDFYKTPYAATESLIEAVGEHIPHFVAEPACGEGHIARVLDLYGYDVVSTDLIDRGYGQGGADFLAAPPARNAIVTNPPLKLAVEFIRHAMRYEPVFLALLLKSTFWQADSRFELWIEHPPKLTLPLTYRLDFTGQGAPTMECTWFVWGQFIEHCEAPRPIRRPKESLAEMML